MRLAGQLKLQECEVLDMKSSKEGSTLKIQRMFFLFKMLYGIRYKMFSVEGFKE